MDSFSRSNASRVIGFCGNPRRVNVALSRARRGLVIFGCENTLSADHLWRKLLENIDNLTPILGNDISEVKALNDKQFEGNLRLDASVNFKIGRLLGGREVKGDPLLFYASLLIYLLFPAPVKVLIELLDCEFGFGRRLKGNRYLTNCFNAMAA